MKPLTTQVASAGMVTAPHFLASETGLSILAEGGSAIEAMVAMAASIAVVYPHMNSLGGDGFWLIKQPGKDPIGIDAAGPSAALASMDFYKAEGGGIPERGGASALTVAGTIGGWQEALAIARAEGLRRLPLADLLGPAQDQARLGFDVTETQAQLTYEKLAALRDIPGFTAVYLIDGKPPLKDFRFCQPGLANTLGQLVKAGLDDFYRGDLAASHAAYLEDHGSPLRLADLNAYRAKQIAPLRLPMRYGTLFNMPPPTQGVSALMILGLFDRLGVTKAEGFQHIHGLVEATKQAFRIRNAELSDLTFMREDPEQWLEREFLDHLAAQIDPNCAQQWPDDGSGGDTIWMGAIDKDGTAVSFIQSTYWEFGSGLTCPETGVVWQNRGLGFSMDPSHPNVLAPHKRPFHTLNPAMAIFDDGRSMVFGTMGGEGQPQTQAAIFSRYAYFGDDLQEAITKPRWLLGRTWGDNSTSLKLENRFDKEVVKRLVDAGHKVERVAPFTSTMGHAGAVVRTADGKFEGATDPRSDGRAIGLS